MVCKIKAYKCLCELSEFTINGIKADYSDFGTKEDRDRGNAEPYCCENMKFIPYNEPDPKVLEKYNITEDDWIIICYKIDKAISFGRCGWCS